jgi:hypothetical protein
MTTFNYRRLSDSRSCLHRVEKDLAFVGNDWDHDNMGSGVGECVYTEMLVGRRGCASESSALIGSHPIDLTATYMDPTTIPLLFSPDL